ncbi:sensor histidine kinase [Alicyclobacillus sp. ALC3]|uniref:sensor histidine kinase n=1 Tax=Alicyclobacillus sp. ALC3 TaxID=2796143 RepID=UPI002379CA77|nr:sensor histidine kinase [Alicyclobacillus sp. ALC3]WDL95634.1 sensor histidine kinase [Alicyclobacillus sp. ALC3]
MLIVLALVVIAFSVVIGIQYHAYRTRSALLDHIHKRLTDIISSDTQEKLLAFTSDDQLIPILKDVNQLLEHHQQEAANFVRMEQSMRKMLSNISHDLKTPLTVVLGYLEAITLDPDMNEEERKLLLSKVYGKAQDVLNLVRRFFDLARIESGDQAVPLSPIHMNEICERNILSFYDTLTVRGFGVTIEIPHQPIYAWGNEEALDRVLTNLIANAVQHGAEGMVVGLTLRSDGEFLFVDVWDRGKGIDELYQDRVFERMYTLEDSRNKAYQGSGLGLTITKRLVEAQGGTIHIDSKPYDKTVFTIRLKRISFTT